MTNLTDQQRDAVEWLKVFLHGGALPPSATYAQVLLDALANPQPLLPLLPTEPGMYVSHTDKHGAWLLHGDGEWWPPFRDYSVPLSEVQAAAPFTRLVPERPPVTLFEIACAYQDATNDHMIEDGIKAIATLVNGTRA